MPTTVHSDEELEQVEETEPGVDGYWPAIEILNERKHDYLVNWDGINPDTGRAWTPSWTKKTEVTEDLVEAWETAKATKGKNNRRASKKQKRSRESVTPTPSKPANRSSRSSRNSFMSSSRAADSPAFSLTSTNTSRVAEEMSLGKRKRRGTRHASSDKEPKPLTKKQRIDRASSSTSKNSPVKSRRDSKRISKEAVHEEEEEEGPEIIPRLSSASKAGPASAPVRIGPPRKRKKIAPLPPITPPSSRVPGTTLRNPREEEETTQEAVGNIPHLDSNSQTVKKKKRRLKPPSDVRPKPLTSVEKKPLVTPSRDTTQEPEEHIDQGGPIVDPPPLDLDDEPLPDPTPPGSTMQKSPDPPVDDNLSTPTPPRVKKNAKKLAPIPKLDSSHFKPYLRLEDTTSVIDEFSPKKQFHTQDTIEPSAGGSQFRRTAVEPPQKRPMSIDDLFNDDDAAPTTQHVEDSYVGLNGQADEAETQNEEHPPTDTDSTEQERLLPLSPAGSEDASAPMQSSNSRKLENALVLLNQKSEEIEVLESRLAAHEAQIEHLQDENHMIQLECEKLSVAQEVQREALEDAKGTVSEMGVHIDWVQDSLDKSEAKVKEFQGELDEIREALDAKVEQHNLMRMEWEQEKASLEARLASVPEALPQQPPASWELEKKELEDGLADLTVERDQLDKDKRRAEDEVESWKEQYRNEFIRSQGLRREAEDAKAETSRVREENAILARQTKDAVKLVTAKYETVVEILRKELGKAESLYKVLQAKDEQTGDDLRRRAASATNLQEEVRRLREELDLELEREAARMAELEGEVRYTCQFALDNGRCGQDFDSPEELWGHALGHIPSRKHK